MPRESYEQQAKSVRKALNGEKLTEADLRHLERAAANLEEIASVRKWFLRGIEDTDVAADKLIHLLHLPRDGVVKA